MAKALRATSPRTPSDWSWSQNLAQRLDNQTGHWKSCNHKSISERTWPDEPPAVWDFENQVLRTHTEREI